MIIKLSNSASSLYRTFDSFFVNDYYDEHAKKSLYWYFSCEQFFSYSYFNYRFKSREDVEKLVEDIIIKSAEGKMPIYDINLELKNLGIELL